MNAGRGRINQLAPPIVNACTVYLAYSHDCHSIPALKAKDSVVIDLYP